MYSSFIGVIKCKKDSGNSINCATCVSPQLLNNSQVFQLKSEQLDCKRPSIDSPLKTGETNYWEDTEPDLPYTKDLEPPLGHLTFTLSDSHENVAHVACEVSQPSESSSVMWDTLKSSDILVNVTLVSLLVCDIDRDMLHNMWRLIAYYYESPALLDRGAKHENTSHTGFQYSQAVNEDAAYFTDLKGHLMAEPSWLLQPRITLQLNRRKTTTKKLVLNFGTSLTNHQVTNAKVQSSWAVIQRGMTTQVQSVIQGSNVSFECKVHGSEQTPVEWMLPDLMLLEKSHSDNIITEDNKLHINNVTAADSGLYHCLVKTDIDVDTVSFRLAVREEPSQRDLNGKKISVKSGSVLTLDCSVSAPHPSDTSWYGPTSKILTPSQQKGRVYTLPNNTLVIKNVSHDDGGVYSCLAVNLYGVNVLSHLLVVTGKRVEKGEQVNINENESPLSDAKIENEGSGSEEIEYQFPKQQQTSTGKERGSGFSRGVKRNRGKYKFRMLNKFAKEIGSTNRAEKLENANAAGPSMPSTTWMTTMASQENVTSITTTTIAAKMITVKTTYRTDLAKHKQSDKLHSTEQMKTVHHQNGYSDFPGENDTMTFQSKSGITDTRPEIKLRNRLGTNFTHIRRPPNSRRRRPSLQRPNGYPHDSETSINATSWIQTKNRNHINAGPTERIINRKHLFKGGHINYPTTTNLPQSHEHTEAGGRATHAVINHTTEDGTLLNNSSTPSHENNVYQGQIHVKDTEYKHASGENISNERSYTKPNKLIFKTTFSPRKLELTTAMPLSATVWHVGMTGQPSKNVQGWTSFMTTRPEIRQWFPGPIIPTYNTKNGQTIATHPTHYPSSSNDLLLFSRLRNRHRQSQFNSLLLKFGKLVTPTPQMIKPTPVSGQAPKPSHHHKALSPLPTPSATPTIYSTAALMHYDRPLSPKELSTTGPLTDLMTRAMKPQVASANTVVVSAPAESNVSLPCQASGSPEPTISWRRVSKGDQLIIIDY